MPHVQSWPDARCTVGLGVGWVPKVKAKHLRSTFGLVHTAVGTSFGQRDSQSGGLCFAFFHWLVAETSFGFVSL